MNDEHSMMDAMLIMLRKNIPEDAAIMVIMGLYHRFVLLSWAESVIGKAWSLN
jgi:hypothetical protein